MIRAYATSAPAAPLEPFTYEPGPLGHDEVDIRVTACGICHSDLSMVNNEWGISQYPLVPGHEVAGIVHAVGEQVSHLKVGDRVGLGWHASYCMHCPQCMSGHHNLCSQSQATIVGRHGGFAERVRAQAASVVPIPDGVDLLDAGPLFCGGVTVFTPLLQHQIRPVDRVGIVGVGGLGHLAVQFARAWGCEVVAFTSNPDKASSLQQLGAHHVVSSVDPAALEAWQGRLDLIIVTANVALDWAAYIQCLSPRGKLHFVGAVLEPVEIAAFDLIGGQKAVAGSPVGSPETIRTMLAFAARHKIKPVIEVFPMSQVNDALAHLAAGKARYRVVLESDFA